MLDGNKIMQVLPHRYPFVMVDRIVEQKYCEYAIGYKNVSMNEPWVTGHFKDNPIYPGVLIAETAAQIGGFIFYDENSIENKVFGLLSGVNRMKFIRPVVPGDKLEIKAELAQQFKNLAKVSIKATVDGQRVAEGELTYVFSK